MSRGEKHVLDNRLTKINRVLTEFSHGNFSKRLEISGKMDEYDAFMAGINMLGEELREATISRNYFTNIFNSVSDMIFIVDQKGIIETLNKSAASQLGFSIKQLKGHSINELQPSHRKTFFQALLTQVKKGRKPIHYETEFQSASGVNIPVQITASYLEDEGKKKKNVLINAKDVSEKAKTENLIFRAIFDAQEKERQRLARDLHDSLGQQLSAIKFFINASDGTNPNLDQQELMLRSRQALDDVINDMRNICFNLMPQTLAEFGLKKAIQEICRKVQMNNAVKCKLSFDEPFPSLSREAEIDLYRVIQEFIGNALKHGHATQINISFAANKTNCKIILKDNGKGFDPENIRKGMGLQNVRSRVKSHGGDAQIHSEKGKGTRYVLTLPFHN